MRLHIGGRGSVGGPAPADADFKSNPRCSLFLTRGEGPAENHQFAKWTERGTADDGTLAGYTIEKLRHLALTESSEVKYAACNVLWGYGNPPSSDDLRERARDSITSAGCACEADRFGRVVCH